MTLNEILGEGRKRLQAAGISDYVSDAWLIMSELLGIDKSYLILHGNEECSKAYEEEYVVCIKRRQEHEPLQKITGKAYFMGREFSVRGEVLIPRFDTEILVEEAIKEIKSRINKCIKPDLTVLDMCCGSGCIGISMGLEFPQIKVVCADISDEAIRVTNENIGRHGANNVQVVKSDLFENIEEEYDIILSNPPYIQSEVIETLDEEVKNYDPRIALDGGADGLVFYRRIVDDSSKYLKASGSLMMEIGYDEAAQVQEIMAERGYTDLRVVKDYSKLDRVITGRIM
mgnify:CR=1 FL=1